jgi:hypothetical protein
MAIRVSEASQYAAAVPAQGAEVGMGPPAGLRRTPLWKVAARVAERTGYRRRKEARLGLERLGLIYGTDKATHVRNGRSYCDIYDDYLRARRTREFTLLELGVRHGASLRMWNAYFPRASVIGLDVDPGAVSRAEEFQVYIGSQDDADLLGRIADEHPSLEVVVDDASHMNPLTFASFDILFPRLPRGGLYIIEDLAPGAYGPDWPGAEAANVDGAWGAAWPGHEYGPRVSLLDNRKDDIDAFRNRLAYDCDLGPWDESVAGHVAFVHVWPSVLIVGRN